MPSNRTDGIVITEHDTIWSEAEIRELHSYPQLTISALGSHRQREDIVVLGITDAFFHRYMDDAVLERSSTNTRQQFGSPISVSRWSLT